MQNGLMRISSALVGASVAVVAIVATGGVALSSGRGIRTEAAIAPYSDAHDGVVAHAGVSGRARTRTRDGRTEVRVSARGLPRHGDFAARLTSGRCADLGAAFKFDPSGPATRDNEVWLDLRTRGRGEAGDRVRVQPFPSGHLFSVVVYAHGNPDPGDRIACGDLRPD